MASILIRGIPREVLEALKRRASANHRSLEMEVRQALVKLADEGPPADPPPLAMNFSQAPRTDSTWSREEVYGDDGR